MVLGATVDADLFAYAEDDLEASVQVFFVRGGRIRGQRGWIVEKVNDSTDAQLIEQLIAQVYSGYCGEPRLPEGRREEPEQLRYSALRAGAGGARE